MGTQVPISSLVLLAHAGGETVLLLCCEHAAPDENTPTNPSFLQDQGQTEGPFSSHQRFVTWPQMPFPVYFFTLLHRSFASAFREHFLCARHRARLSNCILLCCPHNNPAPILPVITQTALSCHCIFVHAVPTLASSSLHTPSY